MLGRPPTIREDDLLEAARAVFLERGLEATTAEIADRAGVSQSILFYRYKTKEALFVAVVDKYTFVPPLFEKLEERVGCGRISDHLNEVGTAIVATMQTVLPLMMLAWSSPTHLAAINERMQCPHPVRERMVGLLTQYFAAEVRQKRLRAVDPEILARAFFGSVVDFVFSRYLHRAADSLPKSAPAFLRGLTDVLLRGAAARPPAAQPR